MNENAPYNDDCRMTTFITGGAEGIGRAISLIFASRGWNIICHYFTSSRSAEKLQSEIREMGRQCELVQGDLSSSRDIDAIIERIRNFKIDSLINNAGSYVIKKSFCDLNFEDLKSVFAVNTFAPILLTSKVFEKMKGNSFGRIVNISSISAKYGGSSQSLHYGCSKLALEGLTKTLAKEGAKHNVLVNTLRPGVIDTGFHKKYPQNMDQRLSMIPMKRMGSAEEVANMVYFLGSEKNTYITNETITIAGGE